MVNDDVVFTKKAWRTGIYDKETESKACLIWEY